MIILGEKEDNLLPQADHTTLQLALRKNPTTIAPI